MLKVNTLFPSPKDEEGRTKGGVILVKLKPKQDVKKPELRISSTYLKYSLLFYPPIILYFHFLKIYNT
jgi:hypothetical protein